MFLKHFLFFFSGTSHTLSWTARGTSSFASTDQEKDSGTWGCQCPACGHHIIWDHHERQVISAAPWMENTDCRWRPSYQEHPLQTHKVQSDCTIVLKVIFTQCWFYPFIPSNYDTPRNELRRVNVFDPLVSQSDSPVFLVSTTPLKPLNRISWNFVVMKDIMCRCAYPQEILIQFIFSELRPFWT